MLPALFVSHGSPTMILDEAPARRFLAELPRSLPRRPRAVLVVSAHWETAAPAVTAVAQNETIHDFYGFPRPLYGIAYPAPGSLALAERVEALLSPAYPVSRDTRRGLDHGAWAPLKLMFPEADVPVVQLSVQPHLGPAHHYELGRHLAPLLAEDVLIMGSGSFTHDLRSFGAHRHTIEAREPAWVTSFAEWMGDAIEAGRLEDVLDYRARAPEAVRNHPTEEHLLPLFVPMGAGGLPGRRLHASATYAVLRMDVFAFG